MCEGNAHWIASSTAGLLLTGRYEPVCSRVYCLPDCAFRRCFIRATDRVFHERDHARRIHLTYRVGRALR